MGNRDRTRERDRARYLEAWERLLEKGIVKDSEATFNLPSLDLDLLRLNLHTSVTTWNPYLDEVGEVPMVDEESDGALPADELLPEPGQEGDGSGGD